MTITHIEKWGNGYAVRIPKDIIDRLSVHAGTQIEVREEQGSILLTPVNAPKWQLSELLDMVTQANIHEESDTGKPTGNEVW